MRFYGFAQSEILDAGAGEMLDLQIDPKLAWALRHRDRFPVDVNTADRLQLLRVPGLGERTVDRLLTMRRHRSVSLEDLQRLRVAMKNVRPFLVTADKRGAALGLDDVDLRARLAPKARQLNLFADRA
jgi:predicted DNA-binding helix-hairpin-helix protein